LKVEFQFSRSDPAPLCETIRLMSEIDKVIEEHGGWPLK